MKTSASSPILDQPVGATLVKMVAPAMLGMLMTFLFQLVDTYFIGQLGTEPLAAIGFTYPIYILLVSLLMGFASGVSSTIGKAAGEGDDTKARRLTVVAVATSVAAMAGFTALGLASVTPVFRGLGAQTQHLPMIGDYMNWIYLGLPLLGATLIANGALMAKGVMGRSTVVMGIGGIVNLILDYLLIFGAGPIPAMDLAGAALATVLSWVVTTVLMLGLLIQEGLIPRRFWQVGGQFASLLREIAKIASPAIVAQILNPIAIAVLTRAVAAHGESAVAAFGIVTRAESLLLTCILALSVVLTPLVAQNYGAKKNKRLDAIVALSGRITVYWGILVYGVLLALGSHIGGLFSDDPVVVSIVVSYFQVVGLTFPAFGLALITTSFFNGVYQPKLSLHLTLVKSLGLTVPLALGGALMGITGIWFGIAAANVLGAIYAGRMINRWLAAHDSSLVGHNPLIDYGRDVQFVIGRLLRRPWSRRET